MALPLPDGMPNHLRPTSWGATLVTVKVDTTGESALKTDDRSGAGVWRRANRIVGVAGKAGGCMATGGSAAGAGAGSGVVGSG